MSVGVPEKRLIRRPRLTAQDGVGSGQLEGVDGAESSPLPAYTATRSGGDARRPRSSEAARVHDCVGASRQPATACGRCPDALRRTDTRGVGATGG